MRPAAELGPEDRTYRFMPLYRWGSLLLAPATVFLGGLLGYPGVLLRRLRDTRDELVESHRSLESLHRLALAMQSSAASVGEVQEQILTSITRTLGFERAMMAVADPDSHVLMGWLIHRRTDGDRAPSGLFRTVEIPLSPEGGVVARAVLERSPQLVDDGGESKLDLALRQRFGLRHFAALPMIMRDQPIGVLIVDNPDSGRPLGDRDLASLSNLANQAAIMLGSTLLCVDRTRRLTVEEERKRIALEIHDAVSQSLFGMVFTLDACVKMLPDHAATVQERLVELRGIASRLRTDVRRLIFDLWPDEQGSSTFEAELAAYLRELASPPTLQLDVEVSGHLELLDGATRKQLFRLAQEALSNVVRHAGATMARVLLAVDERDVRLAVEDNGCGFEPTAALNGGAPAGHLGLAAMRERTRALDGTVEIESVPGKGTRIIAVVPRLGAAGD